MLCSTTHRFKSVEDLGSPSDAANKLLDRYLNKEFMSTRLGVRRQGEVLAASSREKDGRVYYDIEVRSEHVDKGKRRGGNGKLTRQVSEVELALSLLDVGSWQQVLQKRENLQHCSTRCFGHPAHVHSPAVCFFCRCLSAGAHDLVCFQKPLPGHP